MSRFTASRISAFAIIIALVAAQPARAGTDVFVCSVGDNPATNGFTNWGITGGIHAFSVRTFACNQGNAGANWVETTNQHPVIAQNMFRLRNQRFEQIGQSWLKHTFFAESDSGCTSCTPPNPDIGVVLGVGCCDAYNSFLNGFREYLGPKSEVNPYTGVFPYPPCSGSCPASDTTVGRRLQVADSDLDTTAGVLYFMEGQYILPDDCAASPRTDDNNASYRQISINASKNLSAWIGNTFPGSPAIMAWSANVPGVTTLPLYVPSDGQFWVAAKATDNGNGTWHYEYAVHNLNSDRAAGSFTVPIAPGTSVSNVGFHGVPYHSGEPYDNTDWDLPANGIAGGSLTWSSHPFPANPTFANALRWGTLYNFRFDANIAPTTAPITLGLFKPGSPSFVTLSTVTPGLCNCAGDLNGDHKIDGADIAAFAAAYLGGSPNYCGDVASPGGNIPDDADLTQFVSMLLAGSVCP